MIFVTVGAQMPFDRMVRAIDAWAGAHGRDDVFAQIGPTDYAPRNIRWTKFLEPPQFSEKYREARVIVAHAGTGSILQALELGKPILIMPRRAALHETRNDHQVATAERFHAIGHVPVAWDEHELEHHLDGLEQIAAQHKVGAYASQPLLRAIRDFIES